MTTKSDQECEEAIKQFAEITKTNEALAHSILQDVNYDVEEAIYRYYLDPESGPLPGFIINEVLEADTTKSKTTGNSTSSAQAVESGSSRKRTHDADEAPGPSTAKRSALTGDDDCTEISASSEMITRPPKAILSTTDFPSEITIMSYNVDGLDEGALNARFIAALHVVAQVNPDVLFLQEIVPNIEGKLRSTLGGMYHLFSAQPHSSYPYYTMTAVSKSVKVLKTDVIGFGNSEMGRNLLIVEGQWNGLKLKLLNSHLESMWDHTKARRAQFIEAMEKMRVYTANPNALVVFGGDLNLLDPEVGCLENNSRLFGFSVQNVPPNVRDAWIAAGENKLQKYTWDCKLNDNKNLKPNMRRRFDRFYFSGPYEQLEFYLAGKERRKDIGRFPSDHFAIVCKFKSPKRP